MIDSLHDVDEDYLNRVKSYIYNQYSRVQQEIFDMVYVLHFDSKHAENMPVLDRSVYIQKASDRFKEESESLKRGV